MSPHPVPDQIVTRDELARIMRVSVRTIDRMRAEGMPAVNWGRRLTRFYVGDAIRWASEQSDRKAA